MRIGLALPHYDFSIPGVHPIGFDDVADVTVRAERLGFDSVWMSDHFFASHGLAELVELVRSSIN